MPLEHRKLLQFIVPWICRTDGRFVNRSKNAPYYGFHMTYSPSDEWAPGDPSTTFGAHVPPAVYSQTGAYHLLRALVGQHVETAGIKPDMGSNALHPYFTSTIDFAAMTQAFEQLCTVLTPTALDQLAADLRQHPVRDELVTAKGVTGQLLAVMDGEQGRIVIGGRGRSLCHPGRGRASVRYPGHRHPYRPRRQRSVLPGTLPQLRSPSEQSTDACPVRSGRCRHTYCAVQPALRKFINASMWRGVGMLQDQAGDDVYVAGVAALGAGINLSFGLLDDRSGNDHYQCLGHHENGYSVGQKWDNGYTGGGTAWDIGAGYLLDLGA